MTQKKLLRYIHVGFILLSLNSFAFEEKHPVIFENINEEQGLAHSYVLSIFQDSRGLVWVGTYGGLQVFDGYHFNRFNTSVKKSDILSNHVVNVIFEDKNKFLWFGTEYGLNKYNPATGENKVFLYDSKYPNSLSHNHIRTIYQDEEGVFWIGTYGGGLNRFDEEIEKYTHYRVEDNAPNGLKSNLINSFFVDNRGLFWIGTESGGISVFDKTNETFVKSIQKSPNGLNNNTVNSILQDENGIFWIGTWGGGLNRYDPVSNTFKYFTHNPANGKSITGNNVRCVFQTDKNILWIGTFGEGLNVLNTKTETFQKINTNFSFEDNTAQETIWTIYRDNDNSLWVGTFGRGIIKENVLKNTFDYITIKGNEGVKLGISSVIEDKSAKLWLGTFKGLFIYNPVKNTISPYFLKTVKNLSISNLYRDSKNRIWICSDNALVMVDEKGRERTFIHNVFNPNSISEGSVNSLIEDSKGNIWIGFWGIGINFIPAEELNKVKDEDVVFLKYKKELPDPHAYLDYRIWKIFEDSKGIIWFGSAQRLASYSYEDKLFRSYPIGVVSSFYEDMHGNLWVGSIGNGLFKMDRNRKIVKHYTTENGMANVDVISILPDKLGRLWLGTPSGISLFNPLTDDFSNFDKNFGLQRFSINHNACKVLTNGQLVFGGNNGFNLFTPESIELNLPKSPIILTDIKLNNKSIVYENVLDSSYVIKSSVAFLDTLILDYRNKILSIDFAAANYQIPSSIHYAYKLEGFDDDWVITGLNKSATFTNLSAGEYVFKLRMSYNNGKWIESPHQLKVIVPPPFWGTIWFKIIYVLILAFGLYQLFNFRIKILNKRFEKEKIKKEREIIHLQNEKLNAELDFKNKELAQSTIHLIRKNEDIIEIQNMINEIVEHTTPEGKKKMNQLLRHIAQKLDDRSNWEYFEYNFNLIHNNFLKRFVEKYPDINQNDLKICAYIRMNLSTKEMSNLLNVSYRTIESTRYRIRKKINIESDITLNEYIMRF